MGQLIAMDRDARRRTPAAVVDLSSRRALRQPNAQALPVWVRSAWAVPPATAPSGPTPPPRDAA